VQTLRDYVLPELGARRLSDVQRGDVQDKADRLLARGFDPSTVQNALMALRAIYRRTIRRGDVTLNPTVDLDLPAVQGTRDRIASPIEAERLLAALPDPDRASWATALYAGLRLGELRALQWDDIDLERNVIRVERSWDAIEGVIDTKSRAGRRTVPVPSALRAYLLRHQLLSGRRAGVVFSRTPTTAFDTGGIWKRSRAAWEEAELQPITLHEWSAHICLADDPRGREREVDRNLHGPRVGQDDVRSLWPSDAGQRGGGRQPPRRLPRVGDWRTNWRTLVVTRLAKPLSPESKRQTTLYTTPF
jgi:integrase